MPIHPEPFAVQQVCAIIFIAICVSIAAIAHDWYENRNQRKRGPWR